MEIKNGFDYLKNDESLNRDGIKKVFVFDAVTNKLFSPSAKELGLSGSFFCTLRGGEEGKTLSEAAKLYEFLKNNDFCRTDAIVAVGGGVVTDIAGFVAMTYMRGCRFVSVPTTLLGMIDAAFGGKNGVNAFGLKNLIGGYYQPEKVIINTEFLKTLPEIEMKNGLCEMIKYDMISTEVFAGEFLRSPENIGEIIEKAAKYKISVVKNDPLDVGRRHILNFGHTVGHAVEEFTEGKIPHGIAVAAGMKVEVRLSAFFGKPVENRAKNLDFLLDSLNIELPEVNLIAASRFIKNDKKAEGNNIRAVFVSDDKEAEVISVSLDDYISAVRFVCGG